VSDSLTPSQPSKSTVPLDRRRGNSRGLTQAYDLRDAFAKEALALLADTVAPDLEQRCRRAVAATSLAKGWEAACDWVRIARGRPLPGSLRPTKQTNHRQPRRGLAPKQPQAPPIPGSTNAQPEPNA